MALSNGFSIVNRIFQRGITFPEDISWNRAMDFHRKCPMDFHVCEFWCAMALICNQKGV